MRKYHLRITGDLGFEFWQGVPDNEDKFQSSTYGRVKRFGWKQAMPYGGYKTIPEKILIPSIDEYGYLRLGVRINGTNQVHRICAMTFIPKWKGDYDQVNHINEEKNQNACWNLSWTDAKGNCNWGTRNLRLSKPVLQYDMEGNFIKEWASAKEAAEALHTNSPQIINCANGKARTAYGYVWKKKKAVQ